jgi:MFS family permease
MKKWKFVILGLVINICLGTVYSWSVFKKPLEECLACSATQSGLPYMVFLAAFAFSMPFAGFFLERLGPRLTVIIGGLFVGCGWMISSWARNIQIVTLTYGLIAGMGVGITYGAPLAVAAKWFPEKKGLALGLTLVGFGLSPFVTAPLARYLIESGGVMSAFRILGMAFIAVIVLLALPLRFPKEGEVARKAGAKNAKPEIDIAPSGMLKTMQFYGLWFCYVIGTLAGLTVIGITSPFAQEVTMLTAGSAAIAASIFGIFNGIGRPIFGALTDRVGPKRSAIVAFLLIIVASILVLTLGHVRPIFYIAFAIFWMLLGGWLAIAPAATSAYFGLKNYSKNYGFMFTAYGVGALIGMPISGWLRDSMGSYTFTFYPVMGLAVVGLVVALLTLKRPQAA